MGGAAQFTDQYSDKEASCGSTACSTSPEGLVRLGKAATWVTMH